MTGIYVWTIVRCTLDPSVIPQHVLAVPFTVLATWQFKQNFIDSPMYLRALMNKNPRTIFHRGDPDYDQSVANYVADTGLQFLIWNGRIVWAESSPSVSSLALNTLRSDDAAVVRDNGERMLERALSAHFASPFESPLDNRFIVVDIRHYYGRNPLDRYLRVHARLINPTATHGGRDPKQLVRALERPTERDVLPAPGLGGVGPTH